MNKKKIKINPLMAILFVVLLLYTVSILFVLGWGFMTSFKHFADFRTNPAGFPDFSFWRNSKIPGEDRFYSNYIFAWERFNMKLSATYYEGIINQRKVTHIRQVGFFDALLNTILYAGGCSILATLTPCIVGYMCSKYKNKFSRFVNVGVILIMVLPLFGTTPAMINLFRQLGIFDSFFGPWLTAISFTNMYYLIFYGAFEGLSDTYTEAAEIDGASQLKILVSIAIPLVSKLILTSILLHFVTYWNDYTVSVVFLRTKPTLAYAVYYATQHGFGGQVPKKIAALMMLAIPILILFVIFKDKLMGNISLGGIKE